jgi:squalene-associated FAD-dependent desaturase
VRDIERQDDAKLELKITSAAIDVGIVGGGYAGMAAAVALADRGIQARVYEASSQLGGRARAVQRHGTVLDNGQHLLIGAYRETLELIGRFHPPEKALLRRPLTWRVDTDFEVTTKSLPAPWHLGVGLLRARGIGLGDRFACVRMLASCRRVNFRLAHDTTVARFLAGHRQPAAVIRYLWEPLCLAALNTPIAEASAQVFLNVVRDGLASHRHASDLIFPRIDLTALMPAPAGDFVTRTGGDVRLRETVKRIDANGNGLVVTTSVGTYSHRSVVIATQPDRVEAITGHLPQFGPTLNTIAKLGCRPIVTIYMCYRVGPRMPYPMIGLSRGHAQWLFDRALIANQRGLVAAVISAERTRDGLDHAALAGAIHDEIAALNPGIHAPLWSQVIEEKRATFACTAGVDRPHQRTAIAGLFLAGDYTAGDYPATLEAAVRSGRGAAMLAADAVRAG